jgi:alpha-1,2-mannosyltransferase
VVWLPAAAIIFATGLWLAADCYKAGNEALGVVTTAVTGLLVSPVSWDHHWVWALPVAILLAGWTGRTRWVLLGWIAISALAPAAWSLPRYQWGYPATLLGNLVTDAYVLMALALAVMLAAASLNRRFRYASRLAAGERAEVSHGESVQGTWSSRSR